MAAAYHRRVPDHASVSYWLASSGDDLTPRPALDGSLDADVAILGAGLTGLWTAFYLQRRDPSRRIVIVEREIAGFGASGRNGAWCAPDLNISITRLAKLHGEDAARRMQQATYDAVDEVGRATAEAGIDAGFHRGGEVLVARGPQGVPSLSAALEEYRHFGFGDRYRLIDAAELDTRVRIAGAVQALVSDATAVVHPGRLVRGLARAVERDGTRIVEGTPVTGFRAKDATGRAALVTPHGEVRAPVVVLAGEAYLTELKPLHRQLVPLWSLVVLTEPLSDAQWAEIGWANRETLASTRLSIDYLSRTEDGRILFGGRGAPYRFGSPIRPEYDHHEPTHERLRAFVREWFPSLGRHPLHARLGRSARDAPRLAPDDGLRPGERDRDRPRLRGSRGVDDEPRGPHADRPHHRGAEPAHGAAARQPPVAQLGDRAVPLDRRAVRAVGARTAR